MHTSAKFEGRAQLEIDIKIKKLKLDKTDWLSRFQCNRKAGAFGHRTLTNCSYNALRGSVEGIVAREVSSLFQYFWSLTGKNDSVHKCRVSKKVFFPYL